MFEFDESTITTLKEAYERFTGTGLYVGLFFISIVYIIANVKKQSSNSRVKIALGVFSIIILALNLNPIFAKILIKINGSEVYWRVYWMLPYGITIAYMFADLIFFNDKKYVKILTALVSVAVIILSGDYVYNSTNFQEVNNYYKVEDNLLDIVNYVSNDDSEYKTLAGPADFEVFTRQIDGTIKLATSRVWTEASENDSTQIVYYINTVNYSKIYNYSINKNVNYIVIENSNITEKDDLENYHFDKVHTNSKYTLYKLKETV
jgi:hypothetical protein